MWAPSAELPLIGVAVRLAMTPLIQRAADFAAQAHGSIDQRRKYTNAPYIDHPRAVAKLVEEAGGDEAMICAAWLHDVVEDTPVTGDEIDERFGQDIRAGG